ncbi:UvrD-helicase domain-containing protein [Colwellia sp. 12G3]|uniref:UvrD-helicase domain-containing protein n=1 Tax=Colwellia sp. 12G3 TaxID=2058299 RepID=UPI000C34D6A7|nr:UvrD-helicase domain-containing protein [Colwellia sp. 12G3]PKI17951.1 AAA family ATPase [Colwellia sp. 12G3]
MKCISSSIFGRFIGISTVIEISDSGITIEVKDRLIKFQWEELLAPPQFHLSFFGQILSFKTANKNYVFTMLAYNSKRIQKSNCELLWASASIKRVETLLATIVKITTNRYLRQSSIEPIQLAVNQEWQRWFPWFSLSKLSKLSKSSSKNQATIAKKLQWLSYYQHWQAQGIADCRESYINKQLQAHKAFFDNVESNPLTHRQRRACIIDNDNNLLLAGAGTGKTSVMVGRAGYLLNSRQAESEQILLLAYGRKAADEMDERIKDKLSTDKISATTFHSLGLSIITQVEGKRPNLSVFSQDEKAKSKWIQRYFEKRISEDAQYCELTLEYFVKYFYVERSCFDFKSLGDCYQYFNDNNIRTFKGDRVNSFAELHIANRLFSHGIEYHYQTNYAYGVKTLDRKQYQPNFFLPALNIYLEYYAIDENGGTADYIDNDAYHESIHWKRDTHKKFETKCLEFSFAQHKEGKLLSALMASLIERQSQLNLLPAERFPIALIPSELILSTLNKSGRITDLGQTICQLVGLYKSACLEGELDNILKDKLIANSEHPAQTEKVLALLKPILVAYEQRLTSHAEIDFEDMINKALSYVQTGKFQSPWRYIMVDEFQDISEPRARLVKALRDNNKECSVFAVGDDWQAIYRFSGADFTLTTEFSSYFGATTQSELDQTFRFNNQIGKVATNFISKNPAQINKTIKSLKQVNAPAISLLKRESNLAKSQKATIIDEMGNGALDDVLAAISAQVAKPVNVYVLARFWFLLPNNVDLNRLNNQYPLLTIEAQSFHASKGKEADYVIILGLKKGVHGFPSEQVASTLLDALLAKKEAFEYAEERRLFYVALTRAKDRVYLIADMIEASCFVKELVDEHHIELNEFDTTTSQLFINEINCLVCETGTLKKKTGRFGAFYACTHFPRCEHKEKSCANCESPMTRKRFPGFKICLNDLCENVIPTCSQCDADMILRSSKKGEFWGCQNYKGNEPMSCKNGLDNAKVNWPEQVN